MYPLLSVKDRHDPTQRQIHVRVDRALLRRAKIEAAEKEITLTEWVRWAMAAALRTQKPNKETTNPQMRSTPGLQPGAERSWRCLTIVRAKNGS